MHSFWHKCTCWFSIPTHCWGRLSKNCGGGWIIFQLKFSAMAENGFPKRNKRVLHMVLWREINWKNIHQTIKFLRTFGTPLLLCVSNRNQLVVKHFAFAMQFSIAKWICDDYSKMHYYGSLKCSKSQKYDLCFQLKDNSGFLEMLNHGKTMCVFFSGIQCRIVNIMRIC